jgi:hypothetical protein
MWRLPNLADTRIWLQRGDALPTTGVVDDQTKIIDHDLSRESGVAFIAVDVLGSPRSVGIEVESQALEI